MSGGHWFSLVFLALTYVGLFFGVRDIEFLGLVTLGLVFGVRLGHIDRADEIAELKRELAELRGVEGAD